MKGPIMMSKFGAGCLVLPAMVIILCQLPSAASTADSITFAQQTSGVNVTLWSIKFTDSMHGWACGDNGNLVRTSDGGQHWQKINGLPSRSLNSLDFINTATGWLVTDTGQIYKSTDSGSTWSLQFFLPRSGFADCKFIDDQTGFVSGGTRNGPVTQFNDGIIYKTVNGGTNWSVSASYLISIIGISSLNFPDNHNGWAIGDNENLIKTTNAGQAWSSPISFRTIADSTFLHGKDSVYAFITGLFFRDTLIGYGYGRYGYIVRTRDGGLSWTSVTRVTPWLEGMDFADNARGVIVGEHGVVLVSGDTGATWRMLYPRQQNFYGAAWFRSVFFANPHNGWICGDSGLILKASFYDPQTGIASKKSFINTGGNSALSISNRAGAPIKISFTLAQAGPTSLVLCDLQGRTVRTIASGSMAAGGHTETFAPDNGLRSGVYCISLKGIYANVCVNAVIVR
jgi:photosystem II stability/assembly factor-like uncharacterized protein